uniref:Uncharacterized protein n=1 Tax=Amphimedon queenslandica TaxID=400682 RepID=A0A1X7VTB4_AMPQE
LIRFEQNICKQCQHIYHGICFAKEKPNVRVISYKSKVAINGRNKGLNSMKVLLYEICNEVFKGIFACTTLVLAAAKRPFVIKVK